MINQDFKTAQIAEMKPNESKTIHCDSYKAVQGIRALCIQYLKFHTPEGVEKYATTSTANEDGSYELTITAIAK